MYRLASPPLKEKAHLAQVLSLETISHQEPGCAWDVNEAKQAVLFMFARSHSEKQEPHWAFAPCLHSTKIGSPVPLTELLC